MGSRQPHAKTCKPRRLFMLPMSIHLGLLARLSNHVAYDFCRRILRSELVSPTRLTTKATQLSFCGSSSIYAHLWSGRCSHHHGRVPLVPVGQLSEQGAPIARLHVQTLAPGRSHVTVCFSRVGGLFVESAARLSHGSCFPVAKQSATSGWPQSSPFQYS